MLVAATGCGARPVVAIVGRLTDCLPIDSPFVRSQTHHTTVHVSSQASEMATGFIRPKDHRDHRRQGFSTNPDWEAPRRPPPGEKTVPDHM